MTPRVWARSPGDAEPPDGMRPRGCPHGLRLPVRAPRPRPVWETLRAGGRAACQVARARPRVCPGTFGPAAEPVGDRLGVSVHCGPRGLQGPGRQRGAGRAQAPGGLDGAPLPPWGPRGPPHAHRQPRQGAGPLLLLLLLAGGAGRRAVLAHRLPEAPPAAEDGRLQAAPVAVGRLRGAAPAASLASRHGRRRRS